MRQEKFAVISVNDPALETERMPPAVMGKYISSRDISLLQPYLKAGEPPTIYHVREVPHSQWESFVKEAGDDNLAEQYRRCFLAGVTLVENVYQVDGPHLTKWQPPTVNGRIPDEACERIRACYREEIGMVIWMHSFLDRRKDNCFRLPRSSHAVLIERDFLRVDANQSSPGFSSGEASSASTAPLSSQPEIASSSTTSGDGFASHTGATAPVIQSTDA